MQSALLVEMKFLAATTRATCALLTLASLHFCHMSHAQQANLFRNGDFPGGSRTENLWDGVNSNNQLQLPIRPRLAPRDNATVGSMMMPISAVMADVTGDGLPDIVAANSIGFFWVYVNSGEKGKPRFTHAEMFPITTYIHSRWADPSLLLDEITAYVPRIDLAKWSTPTGLDLVVGTFYGEVFRVPIANFGGKIAFRNFDPAKAEIRLSSTPNYYFLNLADPVVTDWNGDGRKDLLLGEGSFSANTVWFLENLGSDSSPKFEAENAVRLLDGLGEMHLKPAVIDWNNDKRLDLFVVNERGEAKIYLRETDGSLGEGQIVKAGGENFGTMSSVKPVDFDSDGKFDLLIGTSSGNILVALNTGSVESPSFTAPVPITGKDLLAPFERATGWDLKVAPHVPYGVLEIKDDPNNKPLPGFSGGKCLRFYFENLQNKFVEGVLTRPSVSTGHELKSDAVILQPGKKYELTFRAAVEGFSTVNWMLVGIIHSKEKQTEKEITRRGEYIREPEPEEIGRSFIKGKLSATSWTTVKQTITVPSLPGSEENIFHRLIFDFTGSGDFRLDDISIVER